MGNLCCKILEGCLWIASAIIIIHRIFFTNLILSIDTKWTIMSIIVAIYVFLITWRGWKYKHNCRTEKRYPF